MTDPSTPVPSDARLLYEAWRKAMQRAQKNRGLSGEPRWKSLKPWVARVWEWTASGILPQIRAEAAAEARAATLREVADWYSDFLPEPARQPWRDALAAHFNPEASE